MSNKVVRDPKSIIASTLSRLSQEGKPFSEVAGHWELAQKDEDRMTVSMRDLTRFVEALLDELIERKLI